jgi:glutathione S-transferase
MRISTGAFHEVWLVSFKAMKEPAHLALHPFGQIPTYEERDLGRALRGFILCHAFFHFRVPADRHTRNRTAAK